MGFVTNKKILENNYPHSRAIEVFRRPDNYRDHFAFEPKNRNFVFYLTKNCRKCQF